MMDGVVVGVQTKPLLRHFVVLLIMIYFISNEVSATCSDPEVPKDGWRSSPDKHVFATFETVHYYCKTNYTLSGAPKVMCQKDGTWDRKPPVCEDPCGGCSEGGMCIYQESRKKFECICKQGFRGYKCRTPYCKKPDPAENQGYFLRVPSGLQDYDIGTEIIFHCTIGYRISGKNYDIKCELVDGKAKWSSSFPKCIRRRCQNPLQNQLLADGDYNPRSDTYAIGDIVSFTCNAGYELHGASTVRCHVTGVWSVVTWPRCAAKVCPAPPGIPHGQVILTSERSTAGTTIRYTCNTGHGFYLFGAEKQTCVANANGDLIWTPKRPECITQLQFEQYCALQNKVMSFNPSASKPSCVAKLAVDEGTTSTTRQSSLHTLAVVTGVTGGLLGFLLVIIGFVLCQRRRLVRRMRLATTRRARSTEDERMLIYYSNDYHIFLPSYDEAMRSRPAEPPPFEDAVEDEEQQQQHDADAGTIRASSVPENEGRDVVNPISDDENEYETIEQDIDSRSERIRIYNSICESIEQNANCSAEEVQPNIVTNPIDNDGLNDEQSDRASIASSVHSTTDENSPLV